MARTPLAGAIQDAVAALADGEERRTTRTRFVKEAGAAALGVTALGRFAAPARGAGAPKIVVVGAGLGRAERRVRAAQCRLHRRGPRGVRPDRRPLLDAPRRLRRRPDRRARRRADRPGPHRRSASSRRSSGSKLDNLLQAEQNGTDAARVLRRRPVPRRARSPTTSRRPGRRSTPTSRPRATRRTFELSTERGRAARQDVDRRLDRRDVRGRNRLAASASCSTSPTTSSTAPSARSRARSTCSTCSATAARASSASSASRTRSTTSSAATTRSPTGSRRGCPARSRRARSSSRSSRNASGTFTLTFAQASGTKTVTADKVVLALPFSILRSSVDLSKAGFEPLKLIAIREQGMGTNSKLHVQFSSRFWRAPGLERRDVRRHAATRTRGRSRAPSPARAGILVDYTGGNVGASFGSGTPDAAREAVPRADRAGAAGRDEGVERQGGDRLLARLPLDEGLVLVLEGRPVPALRRAWRAGARATASSPASTPRSTSRAT